MTNLEIYNERFAENGWRVLERALNGARQRGQNYVVVEHLIEALVAEESRFFQLLEGLLKIEPGHVQSLIARRLESIPQPAVGGMRLAPSTVALLKQSWKAARNAQRHKIDSFDLIFAIANDERGVLIEMLSELNPDLDTAAETVRVLYQFTRVLSLRSLKSGPRKREWEELPQFTRMSGQLIYIPPKDTKTRFIRPRKLERGGK